MMYLYLTQKRKGGDRFGTGPVLCALFVGSCISPVFCAEAGAADTAASSGTQLEEVVVTAQKRNENQQDVPVSVVAFGAAELAAAGITSTADLDVVTPGLVSAAQGAYAQPHLRGIGTTANGPGVENPIAMYVDGVYYSSMSTSAMALNNIESIEVARGPQGTLFGRNATGGLIQITTRDPGQDFQGSASIGYGNYKTGTINFYAGGGVTRNLAADVAIDVSNQWDGYGRNSYTNMYVNKTQDSAFRSKWVYTPTDTTQVKLIVDFENTESAPAYIPAPGTTPLGGPPYTGPTQGMNGVQQPDGLQRQGGVSLQLKQQLGWAEFMSLTAYRRTYMTNAIDGGLVADPAYALSLNIFEPHRQITQEFQLLSAPTSAVKWVAGAYFYYADAQYDPLAVTGGLIAPYSYSNTYSNQISKSAAIYGQVTKEIFDATNLTLGARYTGERRGVTVTDTLALLDGSYAGPAFSESAARTFTKPTWRLTLDRKFTSDILGYISYDRGFKSGGFNDDLVPVTSYAPETLDAYQGGAKTGWLNNRLRVNTAAFYYKYKNIQAVAYPAGLEDIYNGAAAKLYGVDLDIDAAVSEHVTVKIGGEWLHTAFTSFPNANFTTPVIGGGTNFGTFDATGHHLPFSPDYIVDFSTDYVIPTSIGKLKINGTYSYNNGWFAEPDSRLSQGAYGLVNASFAWVSTDDLTTVRLWGKNLSDTQYLTIIASQANGDFAEYAPPRNYGITLSRKFR